MVKNITVSESKFIGEWDWKKNNKLSLNPNEITLGSRAEAYWRCSLQNHSYIMKIYNKKAGKKCSYCYGNKVLTGFNDLLTKIPENSLYWSDRNCLKAHEVYFNSNQKHYFHCPKCGLEWKQELKCFNNSKNKCKNCLENKGHNENYFNNIERMSKIFSQNNIINFEDINVKDSRSKYLWCCSLSHEWRATPYNIFKGSNCPYCSYKKVLKGFNDLASKEPEVAQYFDEDYNGLKASEVSHKSNKISYRWYRKNCGHSWTSKASRQVAHNTCRVCEYGLKEIILGINDIFTIYPKLEKLFITELNEILTTYHKNSNKLISIYCEGMKHVIKLNLQNYGGGSIKCKECSTIELTEWTELQSKKKNQQLKRMESNRLLNLYSKDEVELSNFNEDMNNITIGSKKDVLFNCEKCGGFYITNIKNKFRRDRKFNCRFCSGKKVQHGINDLESHLQKESLSKMLNEYAYCNGEAINNVYYNSKKRVIWNCSNCKKFYNRSPYERLIENKNCSNCAKSTGEIELLKFIEDIYGGVIISGANNIIWPYELDIYLPELGIAIGYNGNYWHNDEQLLKRVSMDAISYHSLKRDKCLAKDIKLIFIWESDFLKDREHIKSLISDFIYGGFYHEDLKKLRSEVAR